MGTFSDDYPELQGGPKSRERIVRTYAAQDAERARNARVYSQEAAQAYKENAARAKERAAQRRAIDAQRREQEAFRAAQRAQQREADMANARSRANMQERQLRSSTPRTRVNNPLSSQESQERTRMSMESYERERAARDVLSSSSRRTTNREIIDGRGSIDSRALNERNELVGYTIDERDQHDPMLDVNETKNRWKSHAGQGFVDSPNRTPTRRVIQSSPLGGSDSNGSFLAGIPMIVKILVPVIIILAIVLFFILRP